MQFYLQTFYAVCQHNIPDAYIIIIFKKNSRFFPFQIKYLVFMDFHIQKLNMLFT